VKLPPTEKELMSNLKPFAPINIEGQDSEEGIVLSWTDNSAINAGYRIYRKQAATDWILVGEVNDIETFTDENVSKNQEYEYQVAAYNEVGERLSTQISISANQIVLGAIKSNSEFVYPNPVQEVLNINSEVTYQKFKIRDLSGKLIQAGDFKNVINVNELNSGVYLLQLDDTTQLKFIKE
jgi:hypothetical protein